MSHALLAPSSSTRWTTCTPSARAAEHEPDDSSDFAKEGSLAHLIAETILKSPDKRLSKAQIGAFSAMEFYSDSMLRYCEDYAAFVMEKYRPGRYLFVENKLDLTDYIEEGSGTGDAAIIATDDPEFDYDGDTLYTYDYKFGKGVAVFAENNTQQKIYALGYLAEYGYMFNIKRVVMHIYQPRIVNNSDWMIEVPALLKWAINDLMPKAKIAFAGEGEFVAGPHCQFCKVDYKCRALADYNRELARLEFSDYSMLDDDEILNIFAQRSLFENWIKSVSDYVTNEAFKGKKWPGYKIVESKANRRYKDETELVRILRANNFTDYMKEPQLKGLEEMETTIGSEAFIKLVLPQLVKPRGKPTLAPDSDRRPVFKPGVLDFDDEITENIDLLYN